MRALAPTTAHSTSGKCVVLCSHSLGYAANASYISRTEGRHAQKRHRAVAARGDSRLSPAEVARTITSLVTYGTLSTVDEGGMPLGTYVTFVLDEQGCPLIRLRADASHTRNLKKNPKCTVFAHPVDMPARQLARVTLVGEVEDLSEEEEQEAAQRHAALYGNAIGVDKPQPDDTFKRLNVVDCFYVAGLGEPRAEHIDGKEYCSAEPDELKDSAARIVNMYNTERMSDVMRIAAHELQVPFEEMLWVDVNGLDFKGQTLTGRVATGRYEFRRKAQDDLDVLSLITMAAQEAWEIDRNYVPAMPEMAVRSQA